MTTRQDILDAVERGFERLDKRLDALSETVVADAPVEGPPAAGVAYTLEEYYANDWQDRRIPFTGSRRINKDFFGDPGYFSCFQFKLTAVDGDITILSAEAISDDPALAPRFDPVEMRPGRVIKQGKWMIFRCQTKLPTHRTDIDFKIAIDDGTEDGAQIIDLTADLSSKIRAPL